MDTNHTPLPPPLQFYISFNVIHHPYIDIIAANPCQARAPWLYLHVYNECLSTGITLISRWESSPGRDFTTPILPLSLIGHCVHCLEPDHILADNFLRFFIFSSFEMCK
jgi:hypothetical protein